jgi:taurine--2-oxoglutarate transaminase
VLISDRVVEFFTDRPYPGGLTYSGHPLACAAAVAAITAMTEERIVENAAAIGTEVLGPGLAELMRRHRCVGEVRGLGVFWALELVADRATRAPLVPAGSDSPNRPMEELTAYCLESGLWPFVTASRIHVVPPCSITAQEALLGLEILDEALTVADRYCN